jgi:diguanylate cyclase (GGDEF)-like protein
MGFIRDITERINAEQEIRKLAYHDALTGLPNRVLFNERSILAEAHARRNKKKMGVLSLDLDHFKEINDTLGHDIGDQLLQVVGQRLINLVREEDIVARMGGDEFIILLQEIEHAKDVVATSRKILEALRYPFVFGGHNLHVTTSVGVAIYPEDGQDMHTLLKNADIALYKAKEAGRDNCQMYAQSVSGGISR